MSFLSCVCVCVCVSIACMAEHTRVTLCNVLMPECVSGLRAVSSPASISMFYSFYPRPSETEGLFFFVSEQLGAAAI